MKRVSLAIIAILAWFALIGQLYLNISKNLNPLPETLTRYFSYFTIDTNILVALCATSLLISSRAGLGKFFSKQSSVAAIVLYIVVVSVVYNTILRFIWNPQGLQKVVDELLHLIVPVLFLLYWLIAVPKNELKWKHAFLWMIYPAVYGAFVLTRGYYSKPPFYPYPFIDISQLGVQQGTINSIAFVFIFLVGSFVFIGIGKLMSRSKI